jgi:hypothetical protein
METLLGDDARVYRQLVGSPSAECYIRVLYKEKLFPTRVTPEFISNYRGIDLEVRSLSLLPPIQQSKILPCVTNSTMWWSRTRFRISDCR